MSEPDTQSRDRILYLLHRGFVEVRLLAGAGKSAQAADLADALELVPGMLRDWKPTHMNTIRELLTTYRNRHPSAFDLGERLDHPAPDRF